MGFEFSRSLVLIIQYQLIESYVLREIDSNAIHKFTSQFLRVRSPFSSWVALYNSGFDNFILCQAKLCQAKQSNSTGTGAES